MRDTGSLTSFITLGKRKREKELLLQLSGGGTSSSEGSISGHTASNCHNSAEEGAKNVKAQLIIANGKLIVGDKKRYHCVITGCTKSFSKPSRLQEHERSHTGERPYMCSACNKTYLRENHLQAHSRTHLPDSERPFVCQRLNCEKRFWTSQHLKRHVEMHDGIHPYKCAEVGCDNAFTKHHQLRAHVAAAHSPPGTKSLRCEKTECTKSFSTNQKLKAHMRTHEERRYTCYHQHCVATHESQHFSTWTALQAHLRSAHVPTCPYASCKGKTFTQQKGLRAHPKLHEQQEVEKYLIRELDVDEGLAGDEDSNRPVKRRRGGELGRDWKCTKDGCEKDFKSKKARDTHIKVFHLQRRDFVCTLEDCDLSFGYKHLLQRHTARCHGSAFNDSVTDSHSISSTQTREKHNVIDLLTGKAYKDRTKSSGTSGKLFTCPYPDIAFSGTTASAIEGRGSCAFAFSRAYDFRRHLLAAHSLDVEKDPVDRLVARLRAERSGIIEGSQA